MLIGVTKIRVVFFSHCKANEKLLKNNSLERKIILDNQFFKA